MPHDAGQPSRWIALSIQGDVGPWTCYTSSRGKMVTFLRAPPLNPPTPTQEYFRDVFRNAARQWRLATEPTRTAWAEAATAANLDITGYDLWTWFYYGRKEDQLQTIERQTGIALPRPPG